MEKIKSSGERRITNQRRIGGIWSTEQNRVTLSPDCSDWLITCSQSERQTDKQPTSQPARKTGRHNRTCTNWLTCVVGAVEGSSPWSGQGLRIILKGTLTLTSPPIALVMSLTCNRETRPLLPQLWHGPLYWPISIMVLSSLQSGDLLQSRTRKYKRTPCVL